MITKDQKKEAEVERHAINESTNLNWDWVGTALGLDAEMQKISDYVDVRLYNLSKDDSPESSERAEELLMFWHYFRERGILP